MKRKSKLDNATDTFAKIVVGQLATLPPEVAKAKRKRLHEMSISSQRMPYVAAEKVKDTGIKWATRQEAAALLNARAKRVLKMSGEEFVAKWRAGEFKNLDSGDCPGVIELALLAPQSRKSRGRKKQKRSHQ